MKAGLNPVVSEMLELMANESSGSSSSQVFCSAPFKYKASIVFMVLFALSVVFCYGV